MTTPLRPFVVYGFASVHDTLAAEAALKAAGVTAVAIPSPRELGELCGIAMRVDPADAAAAEQVLASSGLPPWSRVQIDDL
jgi:hypothetical protein